ncbi:prenyltransferase and squalene oxidase repeat protein (macronuclear) [Tetrahymena thermophila SB210]|uniref:Protein farnesyltransferase subunit beta n=1 Tax=Tetrahymena thermophila (strain SB210) TaxID=312017 RepID=Q245J5_TETTS|nr:prenyltransferase and squalene oxidase repeat protein [Tetrahymena thermophila SB210]EAS03637.2 prenyltransferase and squalene oxidase repeat protein [Tetrahymena thermophila SB210]|eukprot:XP_001023883.2 prenyltransferase and squalene oxidase repeat protein [Tetrahymena thermophila SB210]
MSKQRKEDLEGVLKQKDRTIVEQSRVENAVRELYEKILQKELLKKQNLQEKKNNDPEVQNEQKNNDDYVDVDSDEEDDEDIEFGVLNKEAHGNYLRKALFDLKFNIRYYDVGHPWVIFWIIHSIYLLNDPCLTIQDQKILFQLLDFLKKTQDPLGGFCGGHYQFPHIASSYAAICSLVELGSEECLSIVDRKGMYNFLLRCRNPAMKGSFLLCEGGESDMRGVYIAVLIADVLNIMTQELIDGVVDFICSSQTYEGGIAPEPFGEAHGGLSYCGLAALAILKQGHRINLNRFTYWLTEKQMKTEGGFQGRTNKLVDNCYSFWQGATFRILNEITGGAASYNNQLLYDQQKLQAYILLCQEKDGGLYDKPGKFPDLYHTCYSLSGLSSAQRSADNKEEEYFMNKMTSSTKQINVVYNLPQDKLDFAKSFYAKLPPIQ